MNTGHTWFKKGHQINKGRIPWNKGKSGLYKCSKETKRKMHKIMKGKKIHSEEFKKRLSKMRKGQNNPMWGKKFSKELREKMSNARRGKKHWNWKGGKYQNSDGYILIYNPNPPFPNHPKGYILEHRLIIEKYLGRYLKPIEECHHLGRKNDNKPQMLMAFINDSVHKRFEHNPKNIKSEEIIFDGRKL